jgi:hypothetical protein
MKILEQIGAIKSAETCHNHIPTECNVIGAQPRKLLINYSNRTAFVLSEQRTEQTPTKNLQNVYWPSQRLGN